MLMKTNRLTNRYKKGRVGQGQNGSCEITTKRGRDKYNV